MEVLGLGSCCWLGFLERFLGWLATILTVLWWLLFYTSKKWRHFLDVQSFISVLVDRIGWCFFKNFKSRSEVTHAPRFGFPLGPSRPSSTSSRKRTTKGSHCTGMRFLTSLGPWLRRLLSRAKCPPWWCSTGPTLRREAEGKSYRSFRERSSRLALKRFSWKVTVAMASWHTKTCRCVDWRALIFFVGCFRVVYKVVRFSEENHLRSH